jgi:hypothetical protein
MFALALFSSGCVTTHRTPDEPAAAGCEPQACWSELLKQHVNSKGQVNFDAVRTDRAKLAAYVRFIAAESPWNRPEAYSDPEARLAYYLNSYNALAMWGVLENGMPRDFDGFFKRLGFFKLNEYEIGGRFISLYDYENDVIRKVGDPRVHFALNCMSVGCPRLPQEPFPAKNLDNILHAGALEFFNSSQHLRIDHGTKTAHVSEILKFFTGDFVGEGKAPDLISYINKYASEKIPADYQLAFIPYDWTVNRQ